MREYKGHMAKVRLDEEEIILGDGKKEIHFPYTDLVNVEFNKPSGGMNGNVRITYKNGIYVANFTKRMIDSFEELYKVLGNILTELGIDVDNVPIRNDFTPAEMFNYSKINGFCDDIEYSHDLVIQHFECVKKAIMPEEKVLMYFVAKLHKNNGKKDGNYAFAVTDTRLIGAQQQFSKVVLDSFQLETITKLRVETKILSDILYIEMDDEFLMISAHSKTMKNIVEKFSEIVNQAKQDAAKSERRGFIIRGSEADEILKYKNLYDSGIITLEEFEAKKKQLLDL